MQGTQNRHNLKENKLRATLSATKLACRDNAILMQGQTEINEIELKFRNKTVCLWSIDFQQQ